MAQIVQDKLEESLGEESEETMDPSAGPSSPDGIKVSFPFIIISTLFCIYIGDRILMFLSTAFYQ